MLVNCFGDGYSTSTGRRDLGVVLTIDVIAGYLQIPRSTFYNLAQEGKIPDQKVGRHWRFRDETIDRWLERLPEHRRGETGGEDDE